MTTSGKKFINFDGNNEKSTVRVIYILKLKKLTCTSVGSTKLNPLKSW